MRKIYAAGIVSLCVLCLFALSSVEAGGCYQNYSYAQSYSYQQPYQSYSYNYTPVQYKYVQQEVLVPYPVKAVISPEYFFSSQDNYQKAAQNAQNSLVADAAAYRALAILANMQGGGNRVQPGANVPAPYDPRTAPVPQQALQQPRQGVQGAVADPSIPAGLQAVVEAKCLKCHGSQDPKRLDLSDLSKVSKLNRFESWEMVNAGTMPKSAPALADAEERLFRQWATSAKR